MFKLLKNEDNIYEYLVYDLETEFLNGIRRVLYSKLKSYSFDIKNTIIIKNTTNINNEIISHRLSLIPLNVNKSLKYSLNIKNKTNEIKYVYSNDIICEDKNYTIDNNILLLKLKPDEEINLVTSTKISCGEDNISYRPFSVCYFKIMKGIYVKNGVNYDKVKDIVDYYDLDLEKFKKKEGYKLIGYTNEIRDYTKPLKKVLKEDEYTIEEMEYNNKHVYYFTIEMFYKNNKIIEISKNLLIKDFENFNELNKKDISTEKLTRLEIENGNYHTLNIISKYIRNTQNIYSTYNKEHPLKNNIILEYLKQKEENFLNNIINDIIHKINLISC